MCSLYQCFRNTHSKWLCVDPLWKFIVLNCPQNFSFLICDVAVCWLHTSPWYSRAGTWLQRVWKGFLFPARLLCAPQTLSRSVPRPWSCEDFIGGNRFRGAEVELCTHKGLHMSMRCGKWNLALIFNHTFDSEKSNPLSHQFSSIQFRRKRKKKTPNYQVA